MGRDPDRDSSVVMEIYPPISPLPPVYPRPTRTGLDTCLEGKTGSKVRVGLRVHF